MMAFSINGLRFASDSVLAFTTMFSSVLAARASRKVSAAPMGQSHPKWNGSGQRRPKRENASRRPLVTAANRSQGEDCVHWLTGDRVADALDCASS
jgi:hypothetical protein